MLRTRRTRSMSRLRLRSRSSSSKYDFIMSENKNYLVDMNNNTNVYIRDTLQVPSFLEIIKRVRINKITYNLCKFNMYIEFQNDCLKFSECITLKENHSSYKYDYDIKESFLKEKITNKVFGDSDIKNIKIAKLVKKYYTDNNINNNYVNPNIGESYAIVRHEIKENKMPYHIAYVFSKDGNSNITVEGDAGSSYLSIPKFCIYDVKQRRGLGNKNETFHEYYTTYFKPCTTLVLLYKN